MIVKDEASNIVRALSSIPSSYEKIVLDTGSTDDTVSLAKSQGAKVFFHPWNDDFAEARNVACSYCTGKYILVMDADEKLPVYVDRNIQEFIQAHPNHPGAVVLENMIDQEINRHRMVRFFPNHSKYQFKGAVHEGLFQNEEPADYLPMDLTIQHFGYESIYYLDKGKAERYLHLYQKHLDQYPDDGYMLYQTGKLYYSMKQIETAEYYLQRGLMQHERNRLYFPVMLVMLGYVLKEQGKSLEAEQLLNPYLTLYPEFPDLPFLLGLLAMDTGKIDCIERFFLLALTIGDSTKYSSVLGTGSFKASFNLGLFNELTGQKSKAKQYYEYSAKQGFKPARDRLVFLG
ncbi:glycosyltransferase family 2 protein [Paenibacillus terrigena]|uniref:glycosyltransferase family 2 protein n=1 Tax=Paenibacillus terrigena TaxID=369333 RepID=UPI001FE23175|nr:glycosyltransferase family 2 protein [Paenibacillus terrigena]